MSLLHATALVILSLIYHNLNWSLPVENSIMNLINKAETLLNQEDDRLFNEFLFIDTSLDNMLVGIDSEFGASTNLPMANRYLIDSLISLLAENGNGHKFLLCDIIFDKATPIDNALADHFGQLEKYILPEINDNSISELVQFTTLPKAPAYYVSYYYLMTKMEILTRGDNVKTLPVVMYEQIHDRKIRRWWFLLTEGFSYVPRTVFPSFFITYTKMKQTAITLSGVVDMIKSNPGFYEDEVKDKILVVGNFKKDSHQTYIEQLPGSLVLLNTYLTLRKGYHKISILWLITTFILFTLLIYFYVYKKPNVSILKGKWFFVNEFLKLSFVVLLASFLMTIIFKTHFTVVLVIVYVQLLFFFQKFKKDELS